MLIIDNQYRQDAFIKGFFDTQELETNANVKIPESFSLTVGGNSSTEWNEAYNERGAVIVGNGLMWNGSQLEVDILDCSRL